MEYRKFGKLKWKVSALGFGTMRLPIFNNNLSSINEEEAIKMIRYALDHGVNYIDTAYYYHGGNSERVVGKALKGYREKVKVATKMPTWEKKSKAYFEKVFNDQLAKLQTDHIDFYLLHSLNKQFWTKIKNSDYFDWAEKKIDENKIGYLGFSFHDQYEIFQDILDYYKKWTFCQIQYNYMDQNYQAGIRGLKYATNKGLAVVIMEPIAGGLLAIKPPQEITDIWEKSNKKRTPAEWALNWVWNQPEVSVVLSGMSTVEQVIENVKAANHSGPNILTEKELKIIFEVQKKYQGFGFIGCTGCKYCMPCPQNVDIPNIFSLTNEFYKNIGQNDVQEKIKNRYQMEIPQASRPEKCEQCGECEQKCPQNLPIRNLLKRVKKNF
jgi:predicted aldo/keto reductase-like oxidoreductase